MKAIFSKGFKVAVSNFYHLVYCFKLDGQVALWLGGPNNVILLQFAESSELSSLVLSANVLYSLGIFRKVLENDSEFSFLRLVVEQFPHASKRRLS